MSPDLFAEALAALEAGLSVVPPAEDGSKKPITAWKLYQSRRPTGGQLATWYRDAARSGIGYVLGAVSGNRECLEFEDAETWQAFRDTADACGLGDVVDRIVAGYCDATPGGGIHLLYQCDQIGGNTQLARRPKRPEEMRDEHDKIKVKIETRAEGGYVISAPSNGRVHPSGKPYVRRSGGVDTIATIAPEERADLFELARAFDDMPRPDPKQQAAPASPNGVRPGDAFAGQTDWGEVLAPHGWVAVYRRGEETYWRRPGKGRGVSATTNYGGSDLFYPFTSSTAFEQQRSYTKFAAFAVLNHDGDYKAAACDLGAKGFGGHRYLPERSSENLHYEDIRNDSNHPEATSDAMKAGGADQRAAAIPVPPFPTEVFPTAVRALIEAGAQALGCPADLIAVPFLSYGAAAIGNNATIQVKQSFRQRAILWTVVVAPSGSVKTPADKIARGPLAKLQHDASELYEAQMAEYRTALMQWKSRPPEERGREPDKPRLQHFYTGDATFEALAPMLKQNPAVVIARDEIVGLIKACDAYRGGRGGDRQRYLEAWDGSPLKVDRRTQEPLYVPAPALSVTGGCQPLVLPELTREASQHDGFVPRNLWSYQDVGPAEWNWDDVDDALTASVAGLLSQFRALRPTVCHLHPDARTLWADWANENARLTRGARGIAASVSAKLPVQVARIALVLHCLWNPDDPGRMVSRDRLSDAIAVGEYFRQHANRVLLHFDGSTGTGGAALLERVARALARHAVDGSDRWVPKTTIHRSLGNGVKASDLDAALSALRETGRGECRTEATGAKPREEWRALHHDDPPSRRYEDMKISTTGPTAADTESSYLHIFDVEKPNDDDALFAANVADMLTWPPEDLERYRAEVADVPDDDPSKAYDLSLLAAIDERRAAQGVAA